MNYNGLENIRSCMVVLCDQTLLHKGIIVNWLEKFPAYQSICENCKIFPPWTICDIWYVASCLKVVDEQTTKLKQQVW